MGLPKPSRETKFSGAKRTGKYSFTGKVAKSARRHLNREIVIYTAVTTVQVSCYTRRKKKLDVTSTFRTQILGELLPDGTRFSLSMEMSKLMRDKIAQTVSRDQIFRR